MTLAALASAVLLVAAPAAPAPASLAAAETMVRALYGAQAPDASAEAARRLYVPDLAAALIKAGDPSSPEPLPFDMRYGDEDWRVRSMTFHTAPTAAGATVAVRFKSFGFRAEVDWRLVRAQTGWRVYDVTSPAIGDLPAWSFRALLKLKPG